MTGSDSSAQCETYEVVNAAGRGGALILCEHASHHIPPRYKGLGLAEGDCQSHAAWDPGARAVSLALSAALDAPLVASRVSRLVYDLNRPLDAASAIPAKSEVYDIPGNSGLSAEERAARHARWHDPFHAALAQVLDGRRGGAFVTVHSFTPVYNGARREVEIGYLHDAGDRLARAALAAEEARGRYRSALNEPYAASDGVTYTLRKHGEARGLPSLMIEVRNDLIDTEDKARAMAGHLYGTLAAALTADLTEGGGTR